MKFGIVYPSTLASAAGRGADLEDLLARVRSAAAMGYSSFWLGGGYLSKAWRPVPTLARAAAEAPGMEFGTVALLPLHHPVGFAEELASLDVICGGRFTLAVAQGWRDFQFHGYGVPRSERLGRFLEALDVMKAMWTQDRVTYHGKHFHLDDIPGSAPCLRKPRLKVLNAANADRAVLRTPAIADGWLVSTRSTLPTIRQQADKYKTACKSAGVQPYIAAWRECVVAPTRAQALERAKRYAAWLYEDRARLGHNRDLPEQDRIDKPFEELLEGRFIIGTPEECAAEVARYRETGVDEVLLRMQWDGMPNGPALESMRLFAEQVAPKFSLAVRDSGDEVKPSSP
jgi:alkanesulfonate monooxygenase SsuD/methylene tetrahydromethanopterin reductase-like flavin-dependent oxidoreductase (luciferase family)